MNPRTRISVVTALAALLSIAMVAPAAAGAPVTPATVSELPTSWAYGANTSTWVNLTNTTGNYVATIHSYFGVQAILNQTNLSGNVTQVELQRTIAFDYQAEYCTPTCSNPSGAINVNYTALQIAVGFVNFTTGTVLTPSGDVPALAVENTSVRVQGNLTERFDTGYRNAFGMWNTGNDYLTVQAQGALSLGFAPAFGLLPTNLSGANSWTSSSTYTAGGNWSASYAWARNPIFGANSSGSLAPSGSLTSTGTVGLLGSLGPTVTLQKAGATQAVILVLTGPFDLRDGVLFLPSASDIFASSSGQSWSSYADAAGPASTATVNIGARSGHLGLLASSTTYQSEATSSFPTATATVAPFLASVPTTGQPAPSEATLQAQPESVDYAGQQTGCLSESSCPGQIEPVGVGGIKHAWFGAVVVVAVVAVVASLIALGVVSRRRQVPPPPPRTNATLYPTPAGAPPEGSPTSGAPVGRVPPAPPVNDPLGNLW